MDNFDKNIVVRRRYGNYIVIERLPIKIQFGTFNFEEPVYLCVCDCGNLTVVRYMHLREIKSAILHNNISLLRCAQCPQSFKPLADSKYRMSYRNIILKAYGLYDIPKEEYESKLRHYD
jgi:hypothetical protein